MSEQHITQRSSSDFSIARILSNELSSNLEAIFTSSDDKCGEERNEGGKCAKNMIERKGKNDDLKRMEKGQFDKVKNLKEIFEKDEQEEETPKILKEELPWLRCTRYSPPKLPRRSNAGKQLKRRLGSHPRIPFTKLQIQTLEEKYKTSAYLSRKDVIQLAESLDLPQNRVKIWFQNRRARHRRELQPHNINLNS